MKHKTKLMITGIIGFIFLAIQLIFIPFEYLFAIRSALGPLGWIYAIPLMIPGFIGCLLIYISLIAKLEEKK